MIPVDRSVAFLHGSQRRTVAVPSHLSQLLGELRQKVDSEQGKGEP